MPRTIYSERDIEDLARSGAKELVVTDDIYLTDVARERAGKLGIALRTSAAPSSGPSTVSSALPTVSRDETEQVIKKIQSDVIAKLGPGVDAALIERIVRRVVANLH